MEILEFFRISFGAEKERSRVVFGSCFSEILKEKYGMENLPEILANTTYFPSNESQVKKV
jgi:hypothetical protein